MIRVNCPKCGETVEVDESRGAGRKKFRLVCTTCNSRFSIKAAPAPSPPPDESGAEGDSTLVSMPPGMEDQVQSTVPDPPPNIGSMNDGGPEPDTSGLERQLEARRSVWAQENGADAPTTMSFHEEDDGEMGQVGRTGSSAPDQLASSSSGESGEYESVSSGGFEDFADGEIALPGDPDEESMEPQSVDLSISDEVPPQVPDEAVEAIPTPPPDPPPPPEPTPPPEPADEPPSPGEAKPVDAGAMGMSVELEAPMAAGPKAEENTPPPSLSPDSEPEVPAAPTKKRRRKSSRRKVTDEIVVTNLSSVPGYRVEPLGMVTHHFCRQGGGEQDEARKRVRAFGIRYRRGLEALAEQAKKLDANAVVGVEVTIQPTDGTNDPVIWILIQGTAARLIRD